MGHHSASVPSVLPDLLLTTNDETIMNLVFFAATVECGYVSKYFCLISALLHYEPIPILGVQNER